MDDGGLQHRGEAGVAGGLLERSGVVEAVELDHEVAYGGEPGRGAPSTTRCPAVCRIRIGAGMVKKGSSPTTKG